MNHSCAGLEGLARLGYNKDLKVGYGCWDVVRAKQLGSLCSSRKALNNKLAVMCIYEQLIGGLLRTAEFSAHTRTVSFRFEILGKEP